jgi:hypothetical protein
MIDQLKAKAGFEATSTVIEKRGSAMEKDVLASVRNFQKAVEILKKVKVLFWLDQGTLLGCIRDHRLIPWDHDIDFGVWKDQVDRDSLIATFVNNGFKYEYVPLEMDCIHLLSQSGKKIDITFYEREGVTATTKWLAPKSGLFRKLVNRIVISLDSPETSKKINRNALVKSLITSLLNSMILSLPTRIKKRLLDIIKPLSLKYPSLQMLSFNIPIEYLDKFKEIVFLDMEVKIPVEAERYLSLVYGSDWMVPKKNWIWWQECGGLEEVSCDNRKA